MTMDELKNWFSFLAALWSQKLFTIDGQDITLGILLGGIFLFVTGYYVARLLAGQIERRLLNRLEIEASLRYALKTFIFYFLLILVSLVVLRLLNIPVTIFTVLGGALAIGVGFGSQNVMNNFISGLIVMIERPIRVGDFIEVGGLGGRVEEIGARSTRLKSVNNTHFVIPNSFFLEKEVLNWTLSDNVVRTKVAVGVAYGSAAQRVKELLLMAVQEHPLTLKDPKPFVLFADFGDSALIFEAYFWVALDPDVQLREVESDIRFRIDELFRAENISIPFVQRDLHIDSVRPIQVQLLNR